MHFPVDRPRIRWQKGVRRIGETGMSIAIDKNIPAPAGTRGRPARYPFADMEVGDSFAVPLAGETWGKGTSDKAVSRLSNASNSFGKRNNWKFVTRSRKAEGVVRCWRIA
jgi:hypothetical protein